MNKIILAAALGATTLTGAAYAQATPGTQASTTTAPARADAQMQRPGHRMGGGMRGAMGPGALMRADLNHDGVVTRAEVIADADQRFAAMDTDHNGTVTADERRAAMGGKRRGDNTATTAGASGANAAAGTSGDLGFAGRGMGRRGGRGGGRDMTQAQSRDRATRMFDRIDTNHDGQVDKTEIDAARMLMRARMSGGDGGAASPTEDQ